MATLEDRSHPAWQRLKAEELLAQQLSQLQSKRARAALRSPALAAKPQGLHEQLLAALPFKLTAAQQRVGEEIARDLDALFPCTGCCRATSARARPWWQRSRRPSPSTPDGRAR
jgi:ATP-dependent DNA helicase RecG